MHVKLKERILILTSEMNWLRMDIRHPKHNIKIFLLPPKTLNGALNGGKEQVV